MKSHTQSGFGGGSPLSFWYVYILECSDGKYYTGYTKNIQDRLLRNNSRQIPSTKNKLPLELRFYCAYDNHYKAILFDKYLKSGSGMAFRNKRFV